jgi:site-specific DNA-cytosine methylase
MTYTAISLFSGIGAFDLAASLAGFDILAQVEINMFCQKVLEKHHGRYWRNSTLFADVREFGINQFPAGKGIDLIFGGFPCFVAGTMVLTADGYKPIEDIKVGDIVLTHLGNWKPVYSVMRRQAKETVTVKAQSTPAITTTSEHPFFARHCTYVWDNPNRTYKRCFSHPDWVNASNLSKTHFLGQVLPAISNDDAHDCNFWWVVGNYLANGWLVDRKNRKDSGRVVICCPEHKLDVLSSMIHKAGFNFTPVKERTVTKLHIVNVALYRFLRAFGRKAYGKKLPGFVFELPPEKAKSLLDGYLAGDGYTEYAEDGITVKIRQATTVSKALALSMALIAQRCYGIVASVGYHKCKPKTIIEGRIVNQRNSWRLSIYATNRSAFIEGFYGWKKVRSSYVTPNANVTVYNIAVRDDESYIADGAIVHNCQPISLAGKKLGKADSRFLWHEFARIIGEFRPRGVLLENVPNIANIGGVDVIADLTALGYDAQWGVISASDAGAPHRRERWWCVAYPNTHRCETRTPQRGQNQDDEQRVNPINLPGQETHIACGTSDSTQAFQHRLRKGNGHEPRLDRDHDGFRGGMDGHRFPARPFEKPHADEPPRFIPSKTIKHWTARVESLGNALVPQVAYPLFVEIGRQFDLMDGGVTW